MKKEISKGVSRKISKRISLMTCILMITAMVFTGCGGSDAQGTKAPDGTAVTAELANLLEFDGNVIVTSADTEIAAYDGMRFMANDIVATGADSFANIDLDQGRILMMDENTKLEVCQSDDGLLELNLLTGKILNDIEPGGGKYTVRAADTTMAVLGTLFQVKLSSKGVASVDLYEGKVSVTLTKEEKTEEFQLSEGKGFVANEENVTAAFDSGKLPTREAVVSNMPTNMLTHTKNALTERDGQAALIEKIEKVILKAEAKETQSTATPAAPSNNQDKPAKEDKPAKDDKPTKPETPVKPEEPAQDPDGEDTTGPAIGDTTGPAIGDTTGPAIGDTTGPAIGGDDNPSGGTPSGDNPSGDNPSVDDPTVDIPGSDSWWDRFWDLILGRLS